VVAFGISFPGDRGSGRVLKVEYVVNPVWYREHYADQVDDDEEPADVFA
jgi:hypothetical protein